MAIKGYLNSKTYCSITNIIYEKKLSRCTALIEVYSDSTKTKILANTGVTVDGIHMVPSLLTVTPQKTVPKNLGDAFFLIADDAEGALQGLEGRIARQNKLTGEIETYLLEDNRFFLFAEDEEKYRTYKEGKWVEHEDMKSDKRIWDKWFAPEVALAEGTNPTKQMYKFMKTLDQFKDCVDA